MYANKEGRAAEGKDGDYCLQQAHSGFPPLLPVQETLEVLANAPAALQADTGSLCSASRGAVARAASLAVPPPRHRRIMMLRTEGHDVHCAHSKESGPKLVGRCHARPRGRAHVDKAHCA